MIVTKTIVKVLFGGEFDEIEINRIKRSNLGITQQEYSDCIIENTIKIAASAKLGAELIMTNKIPKAQVSKGQSQKADFMAFEGAWRIRECHVRVANDDVAIEARSGG